MKIKCKQCGKEFEAEPVPQTECGTMEASFDSCMVATIDTICPDCKAKS